MAKRIPDIFLSPKQLEERASESKRKAKKLAHGEERERLLKEAGRDQTMADMKRLIGEGETETPRR